MILTSIDLEMNQPSGRIIQIGTAYGNTHDRSVFSGISILVNPQEPITPFIENLTGITNERIVKEGVSLSEAYDQLSSWIKTIDSEGERFLNPVTWGGGDSIALKNELIRNNIIDNNDSRWLYGRRWIDVKTLFISLRVSRGQRLQGGLGRSMIKYGLKFEGRKHDAADDAFNTLQFYFRLMDEFKKEPIT